MNSFEQISNAIREQIIAHLGIENALAAKIELALNTDAQRQQFGDMSCNAALIAAPLLQKNPRELATELVAIIKHPLIAQVQIAGPGFINIFVFPEVYKGILNELHLTGEQFFKPDTHVCQKYNIEFVSANPTGPLHIGHGRGGIIGDVLARVLTFRGDNVTREFYINDAGAQIAKLGLSFKARCAQAAGIDMPLPEDGYHGAYLQELAESCIAQRSSNVLNEPDSFFASYAKEKLLSRIQETLARYGITFDVWFSEKTLHEAGAITEAIQLLDERGHIYTADGATWFRSTTFGDDKDRVLIKQGGELTYVAADIAYLQNKLTRGFDKLVMVLGQDHHSYVTRLKGIMSALGHNPDRLSVILYQLVTLKESGELVRMSKRAGRIVGLQDIITDVGADVARYFYLNKKAEAHLEFDLATAEKQSEENPVFYIQYAYVRTSSMLAKASQVPELAAISIRDADHLTAHEQLIIKKMVSLKKVIHDIAHQHHTSLLAHYVFELAQLFHAYYGSHRVIDLNDISTTRARLTMITELRKTFGVCFSLLGVTQPESM